MEHRQGGEFHEVSKGMLLGEGTTDVGQASSSSVRNVKGEEPIMGGDATNRTKNMAVSAFENVALGVREAKSAVRIGKVLERAPQGPDRVKKPTANGGLQEFKAPMHQASSSDRDPARGMSARNPPTSAWWRALAFARQRRTWDTRIVSGDSDSRPS